MDPSTADEKLIQNHMEAYEVAVELRLPAPDPMSMLELYAPMSFPRQKVGPYEIVTETSETFQITSMAHAQLLGVEAVTLGYGQPIDFHILTGDGSGIMTSDKPDEIYIQYIAFHKMHGRVLVGGLGLGMAPNMIAALPGVTSVTVIEKEPDIIQLVGDNLDPKVTVVQDDLFSYVNRAKPEYDSAYYDTWYSTGRAEWAASVVPLYRASRRLGIETLGAWGEHEMVGQLASALYMQALLKESPPTPRQFWVFIQGLKKELGGKPPYPDSKKARMKELIKLYLYEVGMPEWERIFPWDDYETQGTD
jgi:hypothetical protein